MPAEKTANVLSAPVRPYRLLLLVLRNNITFLPSIAIIHRSRQIGRLRMRCNAERGYDRICRSCFAFEWFSRINKWTQGKIYEKCCGKCTKILRICPLLFSEMRCRHCQHWNRRLYTAYLPTGYVQYLMETIFSCRHYLRRLSSWPMYWRHPLLSEAVVRVLLPASVY